MRRGRQVLALTKLAVIAEGIYKRFTMGKTIDAEAAQTAQVERATPRMAARAIADASADARLRGAA